MLYVCVILTPTVSAELEEEAAKADAILSALLLGNGNFDGIYSASPDEV